MPGKAVRIQLASGVTQAVLPDGRKAVAGQTYNISWEDFQKIAPSARETMITVSSFVTSAANAYNGTDLTINSTTIPTSHELGELIEGTSEGDLYKLVKFVDNNVVAGDVVTWASYSDSTVTSDRAGGSAISTLPYAGVAVASVTATRYGYIQILGEVPSLKVPTGTAAGTTMSISTATDGQTIQSYTTETYTHAFTATGGTFTLSYGGNATTALAYNASAATIQTALRLLAGLSAATVTGTTSKTITTGIAGTNTGDITIGVGSLTGGTATLTKVYDGGNRVALFTTTSAESSNLASAFITSQEGKAKRTWKNKRGWII
jgi:hypothetical protein